MTYDELIAKHEAVLGPRLTTEEVDGLEQDELVTVVWSGGNGPHEYRIERAHGAAECYLTTRVPIGEIGPCDLVWRGGKDRSNG